MPADAATPDPADPDLLLARAPASWAPLLEDLLAIARLKAEESPLDERRLRARPHYERLMRPEPPLLGTLPDELRPAAPQHRRWFAEGVLLWTMLGSVVGDDEVLDTLSTRTLRRFPLDLPESEEARGAVRAALVGALALTESELEEIDRRVALLTSNLRLKQRLTAAIRADLQVEAVAPAARVRLMERFYGPLPLRPGEVDVVVTASSLFFALPLKDDGLQGEQWTARSDAERQEVRELVARIKKGNSARTDRFPSFGHFDRALLDPAFTEALRARVAGEPGFETLRAEVVAETLATMPSILVTSQVEQYLVHDAWGHGWQEALGDFEWPYHKLALVLSPLEPGTGPYFGGPEAAPLRDAFRVAEGRTTLDEECLLRTAEADLRGRMLCGVNGIMAEMLADLMEWKLLRYLRPDPADFPSSSLLPDAVIKVDLSITDTVQHVKWWRRAYARLQEKPEEQARLVAELAATGLPLEGLAEAVARAAAMMAGRFAPLFGAELHPPELSPDGLHCRVGFLERFLVNLVSVGRELDAIFARAVADQAADRWMRPEACVDLLVILMGYFYEQDRERFAWHLDEILHDSLGPSLAALRAELARPGR